MSEHPPHDCPGGCGRQVAHTLFACKPCWFRLPRELRAGITHNYRRDPDAHARAMVDAVDWYRANTRRIDTSSVIS